MALEVRRIVTGHDSRGKAVIATDERLAGTGAAGRAGISRVDVWSTDKMPIDNSDAAAELQRKGFVVRHNYVGPGQRVSGCLVPRCTQMSPAFIDTVRPSSSSRSHSPVRQIA